jgi:benzoylformate decarboxylase/acetolactate synthase-1/2/3 large subunit
MTERQESERQPKYGSDLMADAIEALGVKYISLNPGATFRGLHDSLVNYLDNSVQMIECPHEKLAVGLAHGYTKACGEPMAVVLHNLVGLLHGAMGIYYAYSDRVPVYVFGGSGPMDHDRRRAYIDWVHSANTQGGAVRDYTKWDYEPTSIASVPPVITRAARIAMTEPQGPVYVALDAALQEDELPTDGPPIELMKFSMPSLIAPDPAALRLAAEKLVAAERPVFVTGFAGRDPKAFDQLVELTELLGAGMQDNFYRLNFPNQHPLAVFGTKSLERADCVVLLDMKDTEKATTTVDSITRKTTSRIATDATVIDIGFNDLGIGAWSDDYGAPRNADVMITADTKLALPQLIDACRELIKSETGVAPRNDDWRTEIAQLRAKTRAKWQEQIEESWDVQPMSASRLASEVWEVVKDYDWVLTANTAEEWALKTWNFDKAYRYPGRQLGTATQIGMSLGVALAHKGTGRLVVDLQPDGDLMFDAGALWVASYYKLPMLVVMVNNRAYYNDWEHQERIAVDRGTDIEKAYIGMEIDSPAPDFATLAKSFSWYSEGPITDPNDLQAAVRRAAEHVMTTGEPALVDAVIRRR